MDPGQTVRDQTTPEQFAALQQLLIKERVRHATDRGEVYIPSAAPPDQGFALQNDQDSYDFGQEAQRTIAPSWRNQVTMSSIEAISEHAPGKSIELIAPQIPLAYVTARYAVSLARRGVEPDWSGVFAWLGRLVDIAAGERTGERLQQHSCARSLRSRVTTRELERALRFASAPGAPPQDGYHLPEELLVWRVSATPRILPADA